MRKFEWATLQGAVEAAEVTNNTTFVRFTRLHHREKLVAPLCRLIAGAQDAGLDSSSDLRIEGFSHVPRHVERPAMSHGFNFGFRIYLQSDR